MAQIATVATITGKGTVFAVNEQGVSRQLKAGDVLQKGETIRTVGDVQAELRMDDGRPLAVAPNQTLRLDDNVTQSDQRPTAQDSAVIAPAGTADTVIQALERGTDLSTQLEATAAGLGGGAGADGGNTFVQLLRIVEGVDPLAYAYEYKAPDLLPDLDPEPGLAPTDIVASITIDPITGDNILNAEEAKQPFVTITGTVGGDVKVGDTVTLTINGKDYTGPVAVDANGKLVYSIPVETASLKADSTIDAKVSTTDAAGNTATATDNGAVQLEGVSIEISIASVDGASTTVNEAGLTSPADQSEINGGSFDIATNLGVAAVTIGGTSFTLAQLKALSDANPSAAIDTGEGWMRITGFVGSNGDKAGTISFIYELKAALDNVDDPATAKDEGASFLDSVPVSVTGIGGTVANASIGIDIVDDVPIVTVNAAAEGAITLTTQDGQTTGDASDTASASFAAAFLAAAVPAYGADGAGSTVIGGYTLNVTNGTASGLLSHGESIVLNKNEAGEVVGTTTNGGAIFKISVDASGTVTLTQYSQIDHVGAGNGAQIALAEGKVSLSATVTTTDHDGDTATATVSADLGGNIRFDDDVPSISVTLTTPAADALVVDETALGTNATANFADNFTSTPTNGADGATVASVYALSAVAGNSGLVDTASGQNVVLSLNAGVVEGRTATGGDLVFTLSVNASGTVELDQIRAVKQPTGGASHDEATTLSAANLITLTRTDTITDGDLDTASSSASINIGTALSFKDDGPAISVTLTTPTADALVVDETALGTNATANFADNFTSTPTNGADGATVASVYALSAVAGNSGLVDTASGQNVVLSLNAGVVEGRTATGGDLVFTLSVNASGTVELDQIRAVKQPTGGASHDEATTLSAANLITLTRTDTITDGDLDTASSSASINMGTALSFKDDGPVITSASVAAIDTLTVDETVLATNATANFADNFASAISYGADGAGTTAYTLVLTGSNVASGLYALGAAGAQGSQIVLNQSGNVITGSVGGTDYFTITINNTTGDVTFDQKAAIYHSSTASADDTSTLSAAAGALVLRATVTDADGDVATHNLDLGTASAFNIKDDGPVITSASVAAIDTLTVDETVLATNATANFADNFASAISYGADGAGTTAYTLVLTGSNVASGLYALGAAGAQGSQIVLNQSGNVITGSVGGTDYFTITINNTTGDVTFDQKAAIYHSSTASADDTSTLSAAAGALVLRATVTDADGDVATHNLDLGTASAFNIKDDGPVITSASVAAIDTLTVDETVLATNATANFADNFASAISYGADGAGTTAYTLVLTGSNVASGLYALGAAGAQGSQIVLNQSGNVITGSVGGTDYFTITINNTTGDVTFDQKAAIYHSSTASADDTSTLSAAAGALVLRATVTDADGDVATHNLDLGTASAFNIKDDGPVITSASVAAIDTLTVDETVLATNATANFADNFASAISYGADGAGTTAYTLVLTGSNVASGLYALGAAGAQGSQIVLNQSGNVITGSVGGTDYFTITINNTTGDVTFDQKAAIYHSSTASADDTSTLSAAAGALVLRATVTDADGDVATHNLDLGTASAFNIKDDGPVITSASVAAIDTLTVDETVLATNATANFADNFASAISYGADGAGTTAYTLVLTGSNVASGLYALGAAGAQGSQIVLNQSGNVITGSVGGTDYFTITINNTTGDVTFDQKAAIYHSSTASADDTSTLSAAAGALVLRATVTDADGDVATHNLDLGTASAFNIKDDGPVITSASVAAIDTLTVDETVLATNATANFADNFASAISYGADGAGTTAYTLVLTGSNVASGLYALGAAGAQGSQIVLNQSGNVITGSVGGTDYFTITINNTTGDVTFDQKAAIYHSSTASADDTSTLSAAAGALVLRATVTDADGDVATHNLDLGTAGAFNIKDDGPVITATDSITYNMADALHPSATPAIGTYQFTPGADTTTFATAFGAHALQWKDSTGSYVDLVAGSSGSSGDVSYKTWTALDGSFSVKLNSDGTYEFDLLKPLAAPAPISTGNLLQGITGGSGLSYFDLSPTLFSDAFALRIDGKYKSGADGTVTISNNALGVNGNAIQADEHLSLATIRQPGFESSTVSELTLSLANEGSIKPGSNLSYQIFYTDGTSSAVITEQLSGEAGNLTQPGLVVFNNFDTSKLLSSVELWSDKSTWKVDGITVKYLTNISLDDQTQEFKLTGTDADGDTAAATFAVTVGVGTDGNDVIHTGSGADQVSGGRGDDIVIAGLGADTLIGGLGNDTLTGGTGADVFKWSLGDQGTTGTPANDHIIDFSKADGDKLNLADLLTGHGNDLTQYLSFGSDGTHAVLNVSTTGTLATPDQKIVFDNLTLAQLQTAFSATDSADLIAKMKTNGNLITD